MASCRRGLCKERVNGDSRAPAYALVFQLELSQDDGFVGQRELDQEPLPQDIDVGVGALEQDVLAGCRQGVGRRFAREFGGIGVGLLAEAIENVLGDGEAYPLLLTTEGLAVGFASAGAVDLFVTEVGGHRDARQEAGGGNTDPLGRGGHGGHLGANLGIRRFEEDQLLLE